MQALFENGTVVDIALIIVMAESFWLRLWRFTRGGPSLLSSLPFLASGGFLLIALRTTLSGGNRTTRSSRSPCPASVTRGI